MGAADQSVIYIQPETPVIWIGLLFHAANITAKHQCGIHMLSIQIAYTLPHGLIQSPLFSIGRTI